MHPRTTKLGLLALAALAGCGGYGSPSGPGGGEGGSSSTITVGNDFFSPTPNTVSAEQVTFRWRRPRTGTP